MNIANDHRSSVRRHSSGRPNVERRRPGSTMFGAVVMLVALLGAMLAPVDAAEPGPTYCASMADSSSEAPGRFWLYVNCDTSSSRYTVKVVVRGPNDYRRVLYRGTPEQNDAFIDRWVRMPTRGRYTVVIRDYDPGTSRIPEHRGVERFQIHVY